MQQVPDTDEKALSAYRTRNPVDEPQAVQKARAKQRGRGRMADSPSTSRGWVGRTSSGGLGMASPKTTCSRWLVALHFSPF